MKKRTKKILRKIGLLFVAFFFLPLLSACGKEKEEKIEITFIHGWGSVEAEHEAMRKIYKDFEKKYSNISLNLISMPSSTDVVRKAGDLLSVGEIPDIIFTAGEGRESIYDWMVMKNYALDLMPYLEKDEELKNSISDITLKYWMTEDKKLYTVSDVLLLTGGYWYNENIFQALGIKSPPKTWEEWMEAAAKINFYAGARNLKLSPIILDSSHIVYLTDAFLSEEKIGIPSVMKKEEINIYELSLRRALLQLEKISSVSELVKSFNYRDALASFNAGESAMYINGVWAGGMIHKRLNVHYAPLPTKDGKGVSAISSGVGYILGNSGNEKKMKASIAFLKYMLSEEVAERILRETAQIPANPKIEITEELAGERLFQAIYEVKNAGKKIEAPANIWGTKKKDEFGNQIILYLDKKINLKELQKRMIE